MKGFKVFGSHESLNNRTEAPSPILQRILLFIKSCVTIKLRQTKLGLDPTLASKNEPILKYRALNTRATNRDGLLRILQFYFASIARLKLCRLRNPIPPCSFLKHNFSHCFQRIPLPFSPPEPHQKLFIIFSNSSQSVTGSKNCDTPNLKHTSFIYI